MHSTSSRACASDRSPTRKNKSQSQREYRSKEIDGFTELRDTLLLVCPFDTPLGRDATRHQLLVTAAKKLRNLADENEKLVLRLSAMPNAGLQEPESVTPAMVPQNATVTGAAWSTHGYDPLLMTSEVVPPLQDYIDVSTWSHTPPPFHGQRSYDVALRSGYQTPAVADVWRLQ